jgi:hypothetical protein
MAMQRPTVRRNTATMTMAMGHNNDGATTKAMMTMATA